MKKFISMILVAVMLCMALSSCGEEPTAEPAPLSVTTEAKDYSGLIQSGDRTLLAIEIPTAEKIPVDVIVPVKIKVGLRLSRDPCHEEWVYNATLQIRDVDGKVDERFDVYTSEFKEFEPQQKPKSLISYYGDISLNGDFLISYDEFFEQKTYDFATVYLQLDYRGVASDNLSFRFGYLYEDKLLPIYYATDGEYIAYSVESIAAAQAALEKD